MVEWNPNKNVYIIGAGFGKPARAPLMDEFFAAMQRCYFKHRAEFSAEDKEAFEFALRFREEAAGASDNFVVRLDNLEDLFGLLEVQIVSGRREVAHRRMFIRAIVRTLELRILRPGEGENPNWISVALPVGQHLASILEDSPFRHLLAPEQNLWLYNAFAALVARTHLIHDGGRDSIITFNYDLLLDRAFTELGMHLEYRNGIISRADGYPSPAQPGGGALSPIPIYKLHGSANWIRCERDPASHQFYLSSPTAPTYNPIPGLLHESILRCPHCKRVSLPPDPKLHSPVIIPPTWNKAAYQAGLENVWKGAIEDLSTAGRVIVIGFSLPATDIFFRFLLTSGYPIGKGADLCLFDPNPKVRKRYAEFLSPMFKERKFFPISQITFKELDV